MCKTNHLIFIYPRLATGIFVRCVTFGYIGDLTGVLPQRHSRGSAQIKGRSNVIYARDFKCALRCWRHWLSELEHSNNTRRGWDYIGPEDGNLPASNFKEGIRFAYMLIISGV